MADGGEGSTRRPNNGDSFRDFDIGGSSRVHVGHNIYHGRVPNEAEDMRTALFETDPKIDRRNLMRTKGGRVNGTCQWILENETFKGWLCGDVGVLAISGGPGKGKSMLADFIISELEKTCTPENNSALTYFFCLNANPKRNNLVSVLRGLLYHLVRNCPGLSSCLEPELGSSERRTAVLSSPDILWDILTSMVDGPGTGTIFCVLDGLDECNQDTYLFLRKKLSERATKEETYHRFRIAILSRPSQAFENSAQIRLDPDNDEYVRQDLSIYVSNKLAELEGVIRMDDTSRQQLYDQLVARAQGTFLWVGFAMEELLYQRTLTRVKRRLQEMPEGLPALYARMLRQIPEECRSRCRIMLRWVAVAMRPLSLHEMAGVLDPTLRGDLCDSHLSEIEDLVTECGSLIVVVEKPEEHDAEPDFKANSLADSRECLTKKRTIVVVHQSARDYLLGLGMEDPLEYWRIDPVQSNVDLLRACLQCLESSAYQYEVPDKQASKSSVFDYSCEFVDRHATCELLDPSINLVPDSALEVFQHPFFLENRHMPRYNWFTHAYGRRWSKSKHIRYVKGLCDLQDCKIRPHLVACVVGVLPWLKSLLAQLPDSAGSPKLEEADGGVLLRLAAEGGHAAIVDLLLQNGANPNATDEDGRAALHLAGGMDVIRALLKLPATKINARDSTEMTETSHHRNHATPDETDACLICVKANIDLADNHGLTPLMFAIQYQPSADGIPVIRQLLQAGSSVCKTSVDGSTVLHICVDSAISRWAVHASHSHSADLEVMKLLLDHGADAQAEDNYGRTALDVVFGVVFSSGNHGLPIAYLEHVGKLAKTVTEEHWVQLVAHLIWSPALSERAANDLKDFLELLALHSKSSEDGESITEMEVLCRALATAYRYCRYRGGRNRNHVLYSTQCIQCSSATGYIRLQCLELPHVLFCTECVGVSTYRRRVRRYLGCLGNVMNEEEGWWPYGCEKCHKQIYRQLYTRRLDLNYCAECEPFLRNPELPLERVDIFEESRRMESALERCLDQYSLDPERPPRHPTPVNESVESSVMSN